jgi:sec-independent protein translocase protein TatA
MRPMFSGALSPSHLLLLLVVVVLLFGAKKLPELARGVGRSARILKAEVSGMNEDEKSPEPKPPAELPEGSTKPVASTEKLPDPQDRR